MRHESEIYRSPASSRGRGPANGPSTAGRGTVAHARSWQPGDYDACVLPPTTGREWLALTDEELPVAAAYDWVVEPDCGAVVLFSGTVRDHAEGRSGVERLEYEAYEDVVVRRFGEIAEEMRQRWPTIGRIALIHRVGTLAVGDSAVVTAVSAPHREEAFEAGRFAIDTLKASAPIWKHETWRDGADWGTGAQPIDDVSRIPS